MLRQLDEKAGEIERVKEEKDQEIAIAEEGMETALGQLAEIQQVSGTLYRSHCQTLTAPNQTQGLTDQALNAQIDTLILDNRKKLNQIIGTSRNERLETGPHLETAFCRLYLPELRPEGG